MGFILVHPPSHSFQELKCDWFSSIVGAGHKCPEELTSFVRRMQHLSSMQLCCAAMGNSVGERSAAWRIGRMASVCGGV